jgi:hypothetical protein
LQQKGGEMTKRQYEELLNDCGAPDHDHPKNRGRVPLNFVNKYGTWLRKNDPIAFEVGYREQLTEKALEY